MSNHRSRSALRRSVPLPALALSLLLALPVSAGAELLLFSEDFSSGFGGMTPVTVCGSGSTWSIASTCASSPGAPSPPQHARFGEVPGCSSYSSGNVTVFLRTPSIDARACHGSLTLRFSYLLEFAEGPAYDRARIEVANIRSTIQVASNGTEEFPIPSCSGGANELGTAPLFTDGAWHRPAIDLTSMLPASSLVVRFIGETANGNANGGQGFLVDDVELTCGEAGDEIQVNNFTPDNQIFPAVTATPNGDFVVVWGIDGADPGVRAQRFFADGTEKGNEFQVNTSPAAFGFSLSNGPALATGILGNFVVVWPGEGGSDTSQTGILGQRFNADGTPSGDEFQVNVYTTSFQDEPSVAADNAGNFIVVWRSLGSSGSDDSDSSVQGRLFFANGAPASGEFQVNTYTTSSQLQPSVAADSLGNFFVVWQSNGSSGSDTSNWSIHGKRYLAGGTPVGGEFQVNTYTTSHQTFPAVSADSFGNFVVVWTSHGSSGTDHSITSVQGQRFYADGLRGGGQFQVNTYTPSFQSYSAVAVDNSGFVVVWMSDGSSGSDTSSWSIQGQRFSADGARLGDEFQINSYTTSHQDLARAAAGGKRNVIVWHSDGSFGTDDLGTSIQFRILSPIFADGFESGDTTAWSITVPGN